MDNHRARPRITALLGPTNTGKTHLALERMMRHQSGMIGFPLRLLARENYDRVVRAKGVDAAALITGEEKIVPPTARYYLCTVESMPLDKPVAFVGLDEIQLAADPQRGHVFTDRILHLRGTRETMFMGSDVASEMLNRIVEVDETVTHGRLSSLTYSSHKPVGKLKPRSAVVGFSLADVYTLADMLRRRKGGAAVVLGALSPRTRNAQVELYQSGEVDHLVATDAIGMGLNLDVDHVAFAGLSKFDGKKLRELTLLEKAQIAGRAGRYKRNGTFGVTADCAHFDPADVERIQDHRFPKVERFHWRNRELDFSSPANLMGSLRLRPKENFLSRPKAPEDENHLAWCMANPEVTRYTTSADLVELLWRVCRIPDFNKTFTDDHPKLLSKIFKKLVVNDGIIPEGWLGGQVGRLNDTEGSIETLMSRISNIRIWTYISHQSDWLSAPGEWRERTREIEDELSDALHEKLKLRFIDDLYSIFSMDSSSEEKPRATEDDDVVYVDGFAAGRIEGFSFKPKVGLYAPSKSETERRVVSAARTEAARLLTDRVLDFLASPHERVSIKPDGRVIIFGHATGRLTEGNEPLSPNVKTDISSLIAPKLRDTLRVELNRAVRKIVDEKFKPLRLADSPELSNGARGLLYVLAENLGSATRYKCADQLAAVTDRDRKKLARLGVKVGRVSVYFPELLKPSRVALRFAFATLYSPKVMEYSPDLGRRVSLASSTFPPWLWEKLGYLVCGNIAVRVDTMERVGQLAWDKLRRGILKPDAELLNAAGCKREELGPILGRLGYDKTNEDRFSLRRTLARKRIKRKSP